MLRNGLEPWHVIVLVGVLVLLFGGKRLPEAARGLGRSMRIFKSEVDSMKSDADGVADDVAVPPTVSRDAGR